MKKSKVLNIGTKFVAVCAAAICLLSSCPVLAYAADGADETEKIESPTVEKEIAEVGQDGTLQWEGTSPMPR